MVISVLKSELKGIYKGLQRLYQNYLALSRLGGYVLLYVLVHVGIDLVLDPSVDITPA